MASFFIKSSHVLRKQPSFAAHCHKSCYSLSSSCWKPTQQKITRPHTGTQLDIQTHQVRYMSGRKGMFSQLVDNIKQEMSKNTEMKESLKKFREEADRLDKSDALKKAREKYESIESETKVGSEILKEKLGSFQDTLKKTVDDIEKTEIAQKGKELAGDISKKAAQAAESVSSTGEKLGQTQVFKSVSQGVHAVKQELDETALKKARFYEAPEQLRRRDESAIVTEEKVFEPNLDDTGMVMHKDSKWFQNWQNFKDNNQYVHKMFDLKDKYDESDNLAIRATRAVTDRIGDVFGSLFQKTEMSEVLTEIVKMDPTFDKEEFIKVIQTDIIPNVLEAIVRGELDILKDWCHEGVYNTIAQPLKQAKELGYKLDSKVLDVSHVDILAAKIMDQGPVLVISFTAQQIMAVRSSSGAVVEGDPDKIMRVQHVWALCRDQTILDPRAAWRVVDLSLNPQEQWL